MRPVQETHVRGAGCDVGAETFDCARRPRHAVAMEPVTPTRTRRIDSGEPLTLWHPPEPDIAPGYAVTTAICDNPRCTCTQMYLEIRPLRRLDGGHFERHGAAVHAQIDCDGSAVELEPDTTEALPAGTAPWLRERLQESAHRAWLKERWRRLRGQIGDPAFPCGVPPDDGDGMVSFCEMFPYDFDLTVVHDRQLYLGDDQYCLEPTCTCDEVVVQFVDASRDRAIGHARASVRRLKHAELVGSSLVSRLWSRLLERRDPRSFRDRFERMRKVARARPAAAAPAPKVGRNASCPCGSGKKYKRCCGAL